MDKIDREIIEILRGNSRTPFTNIGKDLGISDATVHVRVKRMLDEGIIKRYTIDVDESTVFGRRVSGILFMNVEPGTVNDVAKQVAENEEVCAVYETHGPNDLILKVEVNDLDGMRDLVLKIRGIPNVVASELTTVFKTWKEN